MQITQTDSLYYKVLFQPMNQCETKTRIKEYGTLILKATQQEGLRFAVKSFILQEELGSSHFSKMMLDFYFIFYCMCATFTGNVMGKG